MLRRLLISVLLSLFCLLVAQAAGLYYLLWLYGSDLGLVKGFDALPRIGVDATN